MKQYYIYKIICLCGEWNGKFYIGKRYGKLDDNYTGSGKLIKEYFKEYGKEKDITYEKIIVEIGDEFNICDLEMEYIKEGMKSKLCLNLCCASSKGTFGQKYSDKTKLKMRLNHADFSGQNNPMYGRAPWNKGKQFSDNHKKHLSEAAKRRWARN